MASASANSSSSLEISSSSDSSRRSSDSSGTLTSTTTDNTDEDRKEVHELVVVAKKDHRDHGRAWLVLTGSFFGGLLSLGNALSLGVLFNHIANIMPWASTSSINIVFALTASLTYIGGTASPAIIGRIGYRYTMLIGALLACTGYVSAAFASQIWHLYITLGLITGTGFGFIFTPSVGIVGQHFNIYKHFAVTTATMGVPLGIIAFSMFHHHIAQAAGFSAAMLANAGACSGLILCAFAVKDPPPVVSRRTREHSNATKKTYFWQKISTVIFLHSRRRNKATTPQPAILQHQTRIISAFSNNVVDENNNTNGGRESPTANAVPLLLTVDGCIDLPAKGSSVEPHQKVELPSRRAQQPLLLCMPKMWWLLCEGLALLAINIYLIITPVYLVRSQGWTRSHAALVVMTHGVSSITFRVMVMAINAYPRLGDRISKFLQAGIGVLCIFACSLAYFFSYLLPTHIGEQQPQGLRNSQQQNLTLSFSASTTSPLTNDAHNNSGLFSESNALYFLAFAFINGAGHTFFLAYQPSIVLEVLGCANLTHAFGYMSFVWGAACLVLYPTAGKLGDVFGSLHTAYLLACACCVASAVALCALVILQRRTKLQTTNL